MFSGKAKIMSSKVITGGTTAYSDTLDMQNYKTFGIQVIPTAGNTLAGTVQLQASNDASSWIDYGSSQNLSTSTVLNFPGVDFPYSCLRVKVVGTAGATSTTFDAIATYKEF